MKNKLVIAILISALLLAGAAGIVLALENLTLRQAIEMSIQYNPQMERAKIRVKKAEMGSDQAQSTVDMLVYLRDLGIPLPYSQLKTIDLTPLQAESGKYLARKAEELTKNQLALETQQKYLNLRRAEESQKLAEKSAARARELKRLAEAAFTAGVAPRSDILGAEAQLAFSEAQLLSAITNVKIAKLDLNKTMGRDLTQPVTLHEPLTLPPVGVPDLEQGLAYALSNRIEILDARENLELKRQALIHATEHNLSSQDQDYRTAQLDLEDASLNLRIVTDNVSFQVHQLYNSLGMLGEKIKTLEKSVSFSSENYRLARLRYEAGLGTQSEVHGAQLNLAELENQLLQSKYDQYLTWLQWLFATGRPVF